MRKMALAPLEKYRPRWWIYTSPQASCRARQPAGLGVQAQHGMEFILVGPGRALSLAALAQHSPSVAFGLGPASQVKGPGAVFLGRA